MSTKYLDLDGLREFYDKTGWVDIAPYLDDGITVPGILIAQFPNGCASGELMSYYESIGTPCGRFDVSSEMYNFNDIFGYGYVDNIFVKRNKKITTNFKLLIRSKDYINLITEGKIQVPISKQIYNQVADITSDKYYILNRICNDSNPVDEHNTPQILKNVYIQYQEGSGNILHISNVMLSVQGTDSMNTEDQLAVTRGYVNEKNFELNSKINENTTKIDTNAQDISNLSKGFNTLQTTVITNLNNITNLQTKVDAITSISTEEIDSIFE